MAQADSNSGLPFEIWDGDFDTGVTTEGNTISVSLGGIADALTMNQATGFVWNAGNNDLDFTLNGDAEDNVFNLISSEDSIALAKTTATWTRRGSTIQSRLLIQKEDAGSRNANAFYLESDTTSRSPDVSFVKKTISGAAMSSGETIGLLRAEGWDGTEFEISSYIQFMSDRSASSGDVPGRIAFVTYDGGTASTKMTIEADASINVGTSRNNSAHFTVDAVDDSIQLKVRGFLGQTANLAVFEDSSSVDQIVFGAEGSAVFNEAGNAAEFRVEGSNDEHLLYTDGVNDGFSMGTPDTTLTINSLTVKPKLLISRNGGDSNINFITLSNSDTSSAGAFMVGARARGLATSITTYQAVQSGDRCLVFRNDAHDGTQFITSADFAFVVGGTVSTGIVPTNFSLQLTDLGGSKNIAFEIRYDGRVTFQDTATGTGQLQIFENGGLRGNQQQNSSGTSDLIWYSTGYVNCFRVDVSANQVNVANSANSQGGLFSADIDAGEVRINKFNSGENLVIESSASGVELFETDTTADRIATHNVTPTSGVHIGSSLALPYVAKTATYTIVEADHTIDCTANTFTVTLPTAVGVTGRIYNIKNSGAGTITLDGDGTETIDGATTAAIAAAVCLTVQSNGANWIIIGRA